LSTLVIIISLTAFGVDLYAANACGYVAGILISYLLNCTFTFKKNYAFKSIFLFSLVSAVCYFANVITIYLSISIGSGPYIAQVVGMCVYTITGFLLNKYVTFK